MGKSREVAEKPRDALSLSTEYSLQFIVGDAIVECHSTIRGTFGRIQSYV